MNKLKIGITTDCVCDLPLSLIQQYHIALIPFQIVTNRGSFSDTQEITSNNILEYMNDGNSAISVPSSVDEYRHFFEKQLNSYDRIIHISMSGTMSPAHVNAREAAESFHGNVCAFDSCDISTGIGLFVVKAAELAEAGESSERIIAYLTGMRSRVSTSFIAYGVDYLLINGKISKFSASICHMLNAHPIIALSKDGKFVMSSIAFGSFERAAKYYIHKQLRHRSDIDRKCIYITHAGCTTKQLQFVKKEVEKYKLTDRIEITTASATISSNCGPGTFGVIFARKKK